MQKLLIILFLLSTVCRLHAQEESIASKQTVSNFVLNYNSEDYDAIFSMFSDEMKTALPLEKTRDFLTSIQTNAGNIINHEFKGYADGSFATYKTTFERAILSLNISSDNNAKINGFLIKPYADKSQPAPARNTTKLILPFHGEWTVFWGGDTRELNYHVATEAQKGAFDIVIRDDQGKSYKTDGKTNEDYYVFGKELIAPCDGEVVMVVDGIKDNIPGEMNPIYVPGNTVIIKTANNEYLFFAHFKQHSIVVKQGEMVQRGDTLGLCGNSGNSSEPHLHFHIQNIEDMNNATGMKCYFDEIFVNGKFMQEYSPIKNDRIRNRE